MKLKYKIINKTIDTLTDAGFSVSDCSGVRSCFDIAAKGENLILIKVLLNIEGMTRKASVELKNVSALTSAIPIVVGDRMKHTSLSRGVIYSRYDIHAINIDTLADMVNEKMPLVYSIRGNYCVRIDSRLLVKLRKELDMTQQELSIELGVAKQSIYRYENSGRISVRIAERLMELFEKGISADVLDDIFNEILIPGEIFEGSGDSTQLGSRDSTHLGNSRDSIYQGDSMHSGGSDRYMTDLKRQVIREFEKIGFLASLTNAPFDVVARDTEKGKKSGETIFAVVGNDTRVLKRNIEILKQISEMLGGYDICISDRNQDVDIAVIKPKELSEINEKKELIEILFTEC